MINKLNAKMKQMNAPVVVGLDPMLSYIPEHIMNKAIAEFGETLEAAGEAIFEYNKGIVDEYRRPKMAFNTVKRLYEKYNPVSQNKTKITLF